jgi:hypothetical protein
MLFGGMTPIQVQVAARGKDSSALFDTWNGYLSSLGLPDYRIDMARANQSNTLMLATFERLRIVLCDRALENDLQMSTPLENRRVYAFDLPTGTLDRDGFAQRFDVLHRTFLGYPAALAPSSRIDSFLKLYQDTVARHAAQGAPTSRFTPTQAGFAAVCYGLMGHAEFHLY